MRYRIRKVNREHKLNSYSGSSWCPGCDATLIRDGSRCPYCGLRKLPKRNKKPRSIDIDIDE